MVAVADGVPRHRVFSKESSQEMVNNIQIGNLTSKDSLLVWRGWTARVRKGTARSDG
jgi:hypothetical protein